ncbi:hypothetical protein AC241_31865 (plasmid) [Bacillus thuringiensis]|nr:DUF4158 domain-containing protein [Bacillus thuringiensis]AKR13250.1 hypothetical protein AC241_31865 [Bacillus thuringiensis]
MVTRELLTSSQRAYFYEIPEYMDQREILRYYTISDEELQIINKQRGAPNSGTATISSFWSHLQN